MANTIKCTHCGKHIEISEALTHELEEKILQESEERHAKEIEKVRLESEKKARLEAIEKVQAQYKAKIDDTKRESEEMQEANRKLQEEMGELLKNLRASREAENKLKIEYQKKLLAEQDKIRDEAKLAAKEELNIEILTKSKKLEDAQKQIDELKRRLAQGSQQLQGEVIELDIESKLREFFIYDTIAEVPKGIRGADVVQTVKTNSGREIGTIIWEIKNTKNWTEGWVAKLKEDQRSLKADLAVIISQVLPDDIQGFGMREGIWISDAKLYISLAHALRSQLMKVYQTKSANDGKATKAEIVYDYLTSNDFKQRIEVWVEYFTDRRNQIDRERMYFTKKWEQEEKSMIKVMDNTAGIYGDLQGLTGSALPKINNLELPEEI